MGKLPLLADAGINTIEVMPISDFPGKFGWGYDGVDLWAPSRLYGRPDDFRRFVDAAHEHGLVGSSSTSSTTTSGRMAAT